MSKSKKVSGGNKFSHIYVEDRAYEFPATQRILAKFQQANIITINHYKNVFNRPRQDFWRQKESQNLILAVKDEPLIYEGPDICENFGNENFYYASTVLNCIYDCHYCYLQGMYQSANIVIFVNIEDFFAEVDRQLKGLGSMYICTSYDTDLLALEAIIPYSREWVNFAQDRENLLMELRTKSANYSSIEDMEPCKSIILAWTLSPEEVIERYEKYTPPLDARIDAICQALADGWNVRLSLEPIVKIDNWEGVYTEFIHMLGQEIPIDEIYDINIGVFRMSKDYFKSIGKNRLDTDIFSHAFDIDDGVVCYGEGECMKNIVAKELFKYYPSEKVYV